VKKYKTRNGEIVHELVVLFDYKAAGLSEPVLQGLKEIFLKFDTDKDGVLTLDQVQLAIRATGRSLTVKEVADLVIGFSSDEKNCSMEFNEFLKMMATEERKDSQPKEEALLEAFRTFDRDGSGKLKIEELLKILTWDDSRLPEGVLEVVKEFRDSDGFIFYEGLAQFLVDGGIGEAKD